MLYKKIVGTFLFAALVLSATLASGYAVDAKMQNKKNVNLNGTVIEKTASAIKISTQGKSPQEITVLTTDDTHYVGRLKKSGASSIRKGDHLIIVAQVSGTTYTAKIVNKIGKGPGYGYGNENDDEHEHEHDDEHENKHKDKHEHENEHEDED